MKRPKPPGKTLQALRPLIEKLTALEEKALRGESMPIVEMGKVLADTFRAVARDVMELTLDQAARAQAASSCSCGNPASPQGFESTFFISRFGRVPVSRRRFRCGLCKSSWFPFDQAWGLPAGEYADDVREATERLSCRLGFDEAVEELRRLWGVAPDASTAHRWVGEDGKRADDMVRNDALARWKRYEEESFAEACGDRRLEKPEAGFGVVEVDGVHALTWKPGREPRRKTDAASAEAATPQPFESASETGERSARHQAPSTLSEVGGSPMGPVGRSPRVHGREVCVGLVYLDEHACEESPGRGALLEKRYVATLNDRESFWRELHAAAAEQGALRREKLVRVSDAGRYFVEHTRELFHDRTLVEILDVQHAKQHVWEAGHKVVGDPKKTAAWAAWRAEAVGNGKVDEVIAELAQELRRRKGISQRKAIEDLSGYFTRNRTMMDYPRYKEAGYPIASAAVESANKRLISRRCKQGGMIWSESGLEAMIALRLAFFNKNTWSRLWPHAA